MKEVTSHHFGLNSNLKVFSYGEKNSGGLHTAYIINGDKRIMFRNNKYCGEIVRENPLDYDMAILFQDGDPSEGFNGLTNEVLLAIIRDRLIDAQSGLFKSDFNLQALVHVDEALIALKKRTYDRITRNVEGTQIV